MADDATITVKGLNQLLGELRDFSDKFQEHALKGACAKACSVLRQEAIRLAPEWEEAVSAGHPPAGTLKKSIYQTRWTSQCGRGREVWFVGVRKGKRFRHMGKTAGKHGPMQGINRDAFYAAWIEYGHYTRVPAAMTKTAKAAGRALGVATYVAPHPFMRPAFEMKKNEATQVMRDYIAKALKSVTSENVYLKAA